MRGWCAVWQSSLLVNWRFSHLALRDETRRRWWCMFGQAQLNDASRLHFSDILAFYKFEDSFRVHAPSHQDLFSLPEAQLPQVVQCKCSRYIDANYKPKPYPRPPDTARGTGAGRLDAHVQAWTTPTRVSRAAHRRTQARITPCPHGSCAYHNMVTGTMGSPVQEPNR